MVVEVNIIVDDLFSFSKGPEFYAVNTLRLEYREENFSAKAFSYGFPRLDMDGYTADYSVDARALFPPKEKKPDEPPGGETRKPRFVVVYMEKLLGGKNERS